MADISSFSPLWGEWYIKDLLGEGTFGAVYRAEKKEYGNTYVSAVKHITIPCKGMEPDELIDEGAVTDMSSVTGYYDDLRDQFIKEINVCYALKGHTNIVTYEDHCIIPKKNGQGYDIFIRMEYLTALTKYLRSHEMTENDVIKLGIDICTGLEVLNEKHLLHRDIKPANIFVSSSGIFKLGDFGEAKILSGASVGMSIRGTYGYMSPEISQGSKANISADIYSLGLVMYRLLNYNRPPFVPLDTPKISAQIQEAANIRRFRGELLPVPANVKSPELCAVVMKACEYNPQNRWQNPRSMRKVLEGFLNDDFVPETIDKEELNRFEKGSSSPFVRGNAASYQSVMPAQNINPVTPSWNNSNNIQDQPTVPSANRTYSREVSINRTPQTYYLYGREQYENQGQPYQQPTIPLSSYHQNVMNPPENPQRQFTKPDLPSGGYQNGMTPNVNFNQQYPMQEIFLYGRESGGQNYQQPTVPASSYYNGQKPNADQGEPDLNPAVPLDRKPSGAKKPSAGIKHDSLNKPQRERYTEPKQPEKVPETTGRCGNYVYYSLDLNGTLTISGYGLMYDIKTGTIRKHTKGASDFFSPWEKLRKNIKRIVIQDGVSYIGDKAFFGCSQCTEIVISESVKEIGELAFGDCKSIVSITLPSKVKSLGNYCFQGCSRLSHIQTQPGLEKIGKCAFEGCASLERIDVSKNNTNFFSHFGVLYSKDRTTLIKYPCSSLGKFRIPNCVTTIGEYAFGDCMNLEEIHIPESVYDIREYAFANCKRIRKIILPENILHIGVFAFINWGSDQKIFANGKSRKPDSWDIEWDHFCSAEIIWEYDDIETISEEQI